MESKTKPQMDDLVRSIGEFAKARDQLARRAERQCAPEVEDVLCTRCRDPKRIERLLDGILDFCFDPAMLRLYNTDLQSRWRPRRQRGADAGVLGVRRGGRRSDNEGIRLKANWYKKLCQYYFVINPGGNRCARQRLS